ncbi:MAG: hypothetical protein ABSF61_01080 [Anaerolineales bacterium]
MNNGATAVLVVSCDRYGDIWEPFFSLFSRYWPDCPYPLYLGANFKTFPSERVQPILVGPDRDWSTNLLRMLEELFHSDLLLLQEDFLLSAVVDTPRVQELVSYAKRKGAGCLRLMPIPGPDEPCRDQEDVGKIRKGSAYRVSLQAAWWHKPVLQALLREGETPWQFEVRGSLRSNDLEFPFLSLREGKGYPLNYFTTAVVRGYWEPGAVEFCRREGIEVDLRARPVLPYSMRVERGLVSRGWPRRLAKVVASPLRLIRKR